MTRMLIEDNRCRAKRFGVANRRLRVYASQRDLGVSRTEALYRVVHGLAEETTKPVRVAALGLGQGAVLPVVGHG